MKIVFATSNNHKASEIRKMIPQNWELLTLVDLGITEDIPETGATLQENAEIKANYVFQKCHIPVFADDTGLIVDALDGRPGVFSARYAGEYATYLENCQLLLQEMQGIANRAARFETSICYIDAQGYKRFFLGEVKGNILNEITGTNGFGYDPLFQPEGFLATFAEMPAEQKNAISHRAKAFLQLYSHFNNISGNANI